MPRKGEEVSEEHKLYLSQINLGKSPPNKGVKASEELCRKNSESHKGLIQSEETRRKRSESLKGGKGPNWKGGITPICTIIRTSGEYKQWIKNVFKKDNYLCYKCNSCGGELEAHHIINFAKLVKEKQELFDLSNGITFCKKCHNYFHKKFGKINNNYQQIFEFVYLNY